MLDTPAHEEPAGGAQRCSTAWPAPASASSRSASAATSLRPTTPARPGSRPRCRSAPTWSRCTSPTPTKGWAVGHDGVVLHSADGGAHLDAPARRPRRRRADGRCTRRRSRRAVRRAGAARRSQALSPRRAPTSRSSTSGSPTRTTGFVVGAFNLIFRTADGGKTWEPLVRRTDNPKACTCTRCARVGGDLYIAGEQGLVLKLDRGSAALPRARLPYKGSFFGIAGNDRAVLVVTACAATCCAAPTAARSWQQVDDRPAGRPRPPARRRATAASCSSARPATCWSARDDGASFSAGHDRAAGAGRRAWLTPAAAALVVAGPRGVAAAAAAR